MIASEAALQIPSLDAFGGSGVYFLYRDGVVVYVGQAVNVRRRIADHLGDGQKRFDAVSMIHCPQSRLLSVEKHYIEQLLPEYNVCSFANSLRFLGKVPVETSPWPNSLEADDAARYLGVDVDILSSWHMTGCAPPRVRSPRSRKGRYPLDALREFASGGRRTQGL